MRQKLPAQTTPCLFLLRRVILLRMRTFIIRADQEVSVRSPQGWWAPETLRSKPTFSVKAHTLDEALKKIEEEVRSRYASKTTEVVGVHIGAAFVREVDSVKRPRKS